MSLSAFPDVLADLLINLSAGWFAAAMIVPNYKQEKGWKRTVILTSDLVFGTVYLLVAIIIKSS